MEKTKIIFIVLFLISLSIKAQKDTIFSKKSPVSIYTFRSFSNDVNGFSSLNKKLHLTNIEFVFIEDIDNNLFAIETKNTSEQFSGFIDDDLRRYQNNNLLKGFSVKYDPTRWNMGRCRK
jgi:hypothetical protein